MTVGQAFAVAETPSVPDTLVMGAMYLFALCILLVAPQRAQTAVVMASVAMLPLLDAGNFSGLSSSQRPLILVLTGAMPFLSTSMLAPPALINAVVLCVYAGVAGACGIAAARCILFTWGRSCSRFRTLQLTLQIAAPPGARMWTSFSYREGLLVIMISLLCATNRYFLERRDRVQLLLRWQLEVGAAVPTVTQLQRAAA
jgi:hypothetical protein